MKVLRTMTALAALVILTCSPSLAAVTEPVITTAVADTDTMTLIIEGFNLTQGALYMGKVGGGVQRLDIISSSATAIEAVLPTNETGSYLIVIAKSTTEFWTGSVTIGAVGPQGPQGDPGADGADGAPGISGHNYQSQLVTNQPSGTTAETTVSCAAGERVFGGGYATNSTSLNFAAYQNYPSSSSSWTVAMNNSTGGNLTYTVWAVCAAVAP